MVPTPEEQPTMALDDLVPILGMGRSSIYNAVARGEIPVIRLGRRLRVPTAALRRMLQLDDGGGAPDAAA